MNFDAVVIHRVLAGHAPMEVCDECPQPSTDLLVKSARLAKCTTDEPTEDTL